MYNFFSHPAPMAIMLVFIAIVIKFISKLLLLVEGLGFWDILKLLGRALT